MKATFRSAAQTKPSQEDMFLTRRGYMTTFALALGGSALRAAAAGAQQGGASPVRARLSLNENPYGPSTLALAAIQSEFASLCRYADGEADVFTPAIVAREQVSADQIVLGEILEALGLHLAANGPRGGEFIYSEPGYTALVNAVGPGGGVAIAVPLNALLENDLTAIAARVNARTRAIYLVNPHNPTGTVSDTAEFIAFVREMAKRTLVIVDEAYLEFEPDFDRRTAVGLTRAGENVVVFRTLGKIYALAGLSVGYAVVPKPLAAALKRAGIGTPETLTRPALAAGAASLQDENYVPVTRAKVVAERDKWHELLERMQLRYSDSRGNFVFFETPRLHADVAAALLAKDIAIGRAFPPLDHWVRISIGLPEENVLAQKAIVELFG